tara:strand:+ start:14943 stop:15494 length:552 start_codon:yes stop_codon:yes gene_type:complete
MIVLVLGVLLFFGIHMLPAFSLNTRLSTKFGEGRYKAAFSIASFVGIGLMIYGFSLAEFVSLWTPMSWGRSLTIGLMPIVVILLCAADSPNNIKRFVRHPMLIGITLWGGTHLAANGDLASTILFASFAVFSLLDIVLVETSGRFKPKEPVSFGWDIGVIVGGLVLYAVLYYFHGSFTGMPLR